MSNRAGRRRSFDDHVLRAYFRRVLAEQTEVDGLPMSRACAAGLAVVRRALEGDRHSRQLLGERAGGRLLRDLLDVLDLQPQRFVAERAELDRLMGRS